MRMVDGQVGAITIMQRIQQGQNNYTTDQALDFRAGLPGDVVGPAGHWCRQHVLKGIEAEAEVSRGRRGRDGREEPSGGMVCAAGELEASSGSESG